MEFKGTKGVWTRYSSSFINSNRPSKHSVYVGTKRIALCYNEFETNKEKNVDELEAEANAKLISKAPEMLEKLKLMVEEFDAEHATTYQFELCHSAKKLIKEATQ